MADEIERIPLSKKGQRQVTPFTGNELLFDFVCGVLDEERRKSVEAHIANSKDAQSDIQKIKSGLAYVEKMKLITVSSVLQERLAAPSTYLSVLFRKARFDKWPVGLKWGLEAIGVVFVIVTALSLAPWEKVLKLKLSTSNEVILTELNKTPIAERSEEDAPKTAETPQFVDEGLKPKDAETSAAKSNVKTATKTTVSATPVSAVAAPAESSANVAAKDKVLPLSPAAPAKVAAVAKAEAQTEAQRESTDASENADTSEAVAAKPGGGFLYRGQLSVTNLEAVGPKIAEKIMEMGGRKAGEVELGWEKTKGSAYFHFTIPEAKYGELKEFLATYGKPRVSLEKHPRVMPDGIIRLIITVDEAKK